MKMKQIAMSFGMLAFVGAVVVGGTGAYFSDTETSVGNVFTAGSVALAIDNIAHNYTGGGQGDDVPTFTLTPDEQNPAAFELDDIKPLDSGDITYTLENQDNSIHLCVLVEDANDDPTAADSALLSMMDFMFEGQAGSVSSAAGVWQSLGTMDAGPTTEDFGVSYCFGTYDDETCVLDTDATYNDAQGGQLMLNLEFYAVQTRNNDDFECESLNSTWDEPVMSSANQDNKDSDLPHINWSINGPFLEIEFVNPTSIQFAAVFDYRIDEEAGTPDQWSNDTIGGTSEIEGQLFGDRYNGVIPGANNTTTLVFNANEVDDKLEVIFRRGAENDWYFDWITFNVID